jgi:hypothetical protein
LLVPPCLVAQTHHRSYGIHSSSCSGLRRSECPRRPSGGTRCPCERALRDRSFRTAGTHSTRHAASAAPAPSVWWLSRLGLRTWVDPNSRPGLDPRNPGSTRRNRGSTRECAPATRGSTSSGPAYSPHWPSPTASEAPVEGTECEKST